MTSSLRIQRGTTSHYQDAAYYDHAYKRRKEDIKFYSDEAAKCGGPILELGVGTGRVMRAIAQLGIKIIGIDLVPQMLERAQNDFNQKPVLLNHIQLIEGDIRSARLSQRFPLIIAPFNVFMHLYTREDIERALTTVREHLEPNGRLIFDVLSPNPRALSFDPTKWFRCGHVKLPNGPKCQYDERFEYDPITQIQIISMAFTPSGSNEEPFTHTLAHRQFFPSELEALLHYNGFSIETRYGDFDRSEMNDASPSQIIIASLYSPNL